MFELLFCSLLTILPDYLYRRYVQGKRFGKEITFFSVWYELRWGITGCLMLTLGLITTLLCLFGEVWIFTTILDVVPDPSITLRPRYGIKMLVR